MSRKEVRPETQVLYRFYDANKALLYVGISQNWMSRLAQHYKNAEWFDQVKYAFFEHFDTRKEVEAAERKALETEGAIYNKAFNPNFESPTDHFAKLKKMVYGQLSVDSKHKYFVNHLQHIRSMDKIWSKKTGTHLAFWVIKEMPQIKPDCDYCTSVFHSNAVNLWANESKNRRRNAAN